jgi:2-haloacid dehalogenase
MVESCRELALQHPEYGEQLAQWGPRYTEMIGGPIDGMVELLGELRGRVRLYLLSNAPAEPIDQLVADWPFLEWFDGLVISGREQLLKPDPRLFQVLLDRFALEADRTVFVDDVERNVAAAAGLGIHAIRFESADQVREALADLGLA